MEQADDFLRQDFFLMARFLFSSRGVLICLLALGGLVATGCQTSGPPPKTVDSVSLERYVGRWYEIASYPVFFNRGLVGVTADYGLLEDGRVSVLNTGFKDTLDGKRETISGAARVVDSATNSKLAVRFDRFPNNLFEGSYWIVALDDDYEYAAVSDSRRFTLFVLSRTPQMEEAVYEEILSQLAENGFDTAKLRRTEQAAR